MELVQPDLQIWLASNVVPQGTVLRKRVMPMTDVKETFSTTVPHALHQIFLYAIEEVARMEIVLQSLTTPNLALSLTAVATPLSARGELAGTSLLALAQTMQEETTALPLHQ